MKCFNFHENFHASTFCRWRLVGQGCGGRGRLSGCNLMCNGHGRLKVNTKQHKATQGTCWIIEYHAYVRWAGQKRQCHIWGDEDQFTKHFSVQEGTRVLTHTHTPPKCMPAERGQILENSRRTRGSSGRRE